MRAIPIPVQVRRLLTQEAAGEGQGHEPLIQACERVLDKLRAHLSKRIGQEGYRTLLARALTVTTVSFPALRALRIGADGSLVGLRGTADADSPETPSDLVAGAVALIERLLELMVTFIGEDLTLRLLSTVWPELVLNDVSGGENERP